MSMSLKVVGTGSDGNCYILEHDGRALILDAGMPIADIKRGLKFNFRKVDGCLITHIHTDHSRSREKLVKMGLKVINPYIDHICFEKSILGAFHVISFDVPHDDTFCNGFLINVEDRKILYATDFEYIKYRFTGLTDIIIECNHMDILEFKGGNYEHVVRGHSSLTTTKNFIIANNNENLKNIILVHLSDTNADADVMADEIKKHVNCNVYVARKGMTIDFDGELEN